MMHASRDVAAEGRGRTGGTYAKAIFDADNHMYETKDALLRYLPEQYRSAIRFVEVEGRTRIALQNASPTTSRTDLRGGGRARHVRGFLRGAQHRGRTLPRWPATRSGHVPSSASPLRASPSWTSRASRRPSCTDAGQPGGAADRERPRAGGAVIHSLNRWMLDTWTFDYKGRIFATPVLTLGIVEAAIDELHWVLENGARAVLIRPRRLRLPGSRSFGLPEFDPFWREVQRAGFRCASTRRTPSSRPTSTSGSRRAPPRAPSDARRSA